MGWDKLTTNKDQNLFRQCVLVQFNKLFSKLFKVPNLNTLLKEKQCYKMSVRTDFRVRVR